MEILEIAVGPLRTNCYIVVSERKNAVVIDPGFESEKIVAKAKAAGANVEYVLLTHGHYDHICAGEGVKKAFPGCKSAVMKEDLELCRNPELAFPGVTGGIEPDMLLEDGDVIKVDELSFKFMLTPGHTKGSACIICGEKMFSGDTLFSRACGRIDLYGGSAKEMRASLKKLGGLEVDYEIFPGHGVGTTLAIERYANQYLRKSMGLEVL